MKLVSFETLARIAEVEYVGFVLQTDQLGVKLRILIKDQSYIDVWISEKMSGRFGFHWERQHLDGKIFRYDNFPDTNWRDVSSFPFHFHKESQENVIDAPFSKDLEQGFREFLEFVRDYLGS